LEINGKPIVDQCGFPRFHARMYIQLQEGGRNFDKLREEDAYK
jgi:hypothetical protein